mgnify:CR=1 FL=1|jgi:hypothetical protein
MLTSQQHAKSTNTLHGVVLNPHITQREQSWENFRNNENDSFLASDKGRLINVQEFDQSTINSGSQGDEPTDFRGYKVPIINWAHTPVAAAFKVYRHAPATLPEPETLYSESEVDFVLNIVKKRYEEFQHDRELVKPFFEKS